MASLLASVRKAAFLAGAAIAVIGACTVGDGNAASAAPFAAPSIGKPAGLLQNAQVFRRGRPPIYPYYYRPARRPGGYDFYLGFVPYSNGDFETQAIQREVPQAAYPPSMTYHNPATRF